MCSSVLRPIFGQLVQLLLLFVLVRNMGLQVLLDQRLNLLVLDGHPDELRDVEGDCLKEQDQADPLVVTQRSFHFKLLA